MDEKKKEEVKNYAKGILDEFSNSLEKVKFKEKKFKKSVGGYREEGKGQISGTDFRNQMFDNAPSKDSDCIIAEKKKW